MRRYRVEIIADHVYVTMSATVHAESIAQAASRVFDAAHTMLTPIGQPHAEHTTDIRVRVRAEN